MVVRGGAGGRGRRKQDLPLLLLLLVRAKPRLLQCHVICAQAQGMLVFPRRILFDLEDMNFALTREYLLIQGEHFTPVTRL